MEFHPYPLFDDDRKKEAEAKLAIYLLAKAHYQRILSETDLLLMFAETFAHNNLAEAIEQIYSAIKFLDERIKELGEWMKREEKKVSDS